MSLKSELKRIKNAKTNIKTAIRSKGVTVSDGDLISVYDAYVNNINTHESELQNIDSMLTQILSGTTT